MKALRYLKARLKTVCAILLLGVVVAGIILFALFAMPFVGIAAMWDFASDKVWPALRGMIVSGWERSQ